MSTILLVEDDPAVRGVVEQHLVQSGFQVIAAPGTTAAMAEIGPARSIDLLLVDLVMPTDQPDGAAFARAARKQLPAVPVVFMTGYYGFVARTGELPGPVLYKPVDLDALVTNIERLLQRDPRAADWPTDQGS